MKRIVLVILITSIVVLGIVTALMIHVFGYVTVNKNYVMPLKLPLHNIVINNDVGNVVITQSQNPKLIIHIMAEGFFLSGNICTLLYGEVNGTLLVALRLNQPCLGFDTSYNFTIYVCLPSVVLNNINVTLDNGNIKIENINFKNADIKVNNGNVEIENINHEYLLK
ncbi:DUF4097 family beta strand repeat-containing protein [Sulfurisphaera tokodaii]|uniref:DUF4097 domain-containing protein n=2 Tax=Sulfurisphaera tokodaii TaxID=111955 RepID=Q96ZT5_SULTO|nr:DUF4097 family beta strand repeat-containing protein [Sulfurisphaera tokodaii]BAB66838.1 hypothetical protein STK_17490 [Sulfurisphaera tokodaii str. 7]HII73369.1 DUF4097 domain-containing protein [Sulfurisphaera tokodaii]